MIAEQLKVEIKLPIFYKVEILGGHNLTTYVPHVTKSDES